MEDASRSLNDSNHIDQNDSENCDPNQLCTITNNVGSTSNSEVTSDTEEYYEYLTIDGQEFRRKMTKRILVERVKVVTMVNAPLNSDGSGPDLSKMNEAQLNTLHSAIDVNTPNIHADVTDSPQKIIQQSQDDKMPSILLSCEDAFKRLTQNYNGDSVNVPSNMAPALLTNYMYRFGRSEFEMPIIDKNISNQLRDDANSTWYQTSEINLPTEKSKSISYFNNIRKKNDDGAIVHIFQHITKSRTFRMKSKSNVSTPPPRYHTVNYLLPRSITQSEELLNEDSTMLDEVFAPKADTINLDKTSLENSLSKEENDSHYSLSTIAHADLPEGTMGTNNPDCLPYSPKSDDGKLFSFILTENNVIPYLIFDDNAKHEECDIAGGPVDALIVHACEGKENLLFLGIFLDTYRTFITPQDLINRLIVRYKYYRSKMINNSNQRYDSTSSQNGSGHIEDVNESEAKRTCLHVLSLLLTIIGKLNHDLNEHTISQILLFEKYLREIKEEKWVVAIERMIITLKQSIEKDNELVCTINEISSHVSSPDPNVNSPILRRDRLTILDISSSELAKQITLLDWVKYRNVELLEVLNLKDIANCKLPGVIEYAKHFQNVQLWTQSILLDPKNGSTERDKYSSKFLRIMKHLRLLNNFSSFIAILLGIQLLPVKKLFSKRIRAKIMELDDYMKPTRFIGYKEDLKHANSPCIPFLGLFYQDIVMLNIANPAYLDLEEVSHSCNQSNWSSNNIQTLLSIKDQCGPIINFWRSSKQYLFLKNCNKDQNKIRYSIKPNEKILRFLDHFRFRFDESTIQRLTKVL